MFVATLLASYFATNLSATSPPHPPAAPDILPSTHYAGAKGGARFLEQRGGVFLVEMTGFEPANLLDLEGLTLTFTPEGDGYRVASGALVWDSDTGTALNATERVGYPSSQVSLGFDFPFAGQTWDEVFVNAYGSISFEGGQNTFHSQVGDRFALISELGPRFEGAVPLIAPLFRQLGGEFDFVLDPQNANTVSFRSAPDHALVTWEISEPYTDLQNFSAVPRINRFQVRLNADGSFLFSYDQLMVEDAVVGVFSPVQDCPTPSLLSTMSDPVDGALPAHIDIRSVSVFDRGSCGFEVRMTLGGAPPPEGDPDLAQLQYTVRIDTTQPFLTIQDFNETQVALGITVDGSFNFIAMGAATFEVNGADVILRFGSSPLMDAGRIAFYAESVDFTDTPLPFDQSPIFIADVPDSGGIAAQIDLAAQDGTAPAMSNAYESFHHVVTPPNSTIACALLGARGDQFDMLVNFTDFRTDTQEAGARSSGSIGTSVSGLSASQQNMSSATFCSSGQLQVIQDYVAMDTPITEETGVHFTTPWTDFGGIVALMSHELGHRWMAFGDAFPDSDPSSITDGQHWVEGLHLDAPGEVTNGFDHSPMGGNFWTDNGNGTFSAGNSGFFLPPKAYGWLDLYLMGLAPPVEVPDFFFLEDIVRTGGSTVQASRREASINDFISQNGPRSPAAATAQTEFTLGVIGIVLPGEEASAMLIENGTAIGAAFERYFSLATEGRAVVDACPGASRAQFASGFEGSSAAFCPERTGD